LNWLADVIKKTDRIICVDGGAKYAAALGVVPHVIVGDMDSVDRDLLHRLSECGALLKEHPADKDDTDTALALADALADNPEEILILGAIGSRFDHTLANVHLLRIALDFGIRARIIDECNEISLIAPGRTEVVEGAPGEIFSLLPLTREVTGVNVREVKWPLQDATFIMGNPYGVSNKLAASKAEISIATGLVLLIKINERGDINCR